MIDVINDVAQIDDNWGNDLSPPLPYENVGARLRSGEHSWIRAVGPALLPCDLRVVFRLRGITQKGTLDRERFLKRSPEVLAHQHGEGHLPGSIKLSQHYCVYFLFFPG